jgi:hypothetical protein
MNAWQIDESEFYELERHEERMQFLLRYTVLAPSTHNTQPWIFRIRDDGVDVFADFSRRLLIADRDDRELLMSVGAAIMNFRVAAARFGYETTVRYEATRAETRPVARIIVRETCAPDRSLAWLLPAISRRHTNRAPFDDQPVDVDVLQRILDLVDDYAETLRVILPRDRTRVADLIEAADRTQMARPAFREELADWIRPHAADGLTADAVGLPRALDGAAAWLVRNIATGSWRAQRDRELLEHSTFLLLVTAGDDRVSLVRAGEVLERLLLTLTLLGLQYSFLNQAVEVDALRQQLRDLAGTRTPAQLLLRVGCALARSDATARRPVEAVIVS